MRLATMFQHLETIPRDFAVGHSPRVSRPCQRLRKICKHHQYVLPDSSLKQQVKICTTSSCITKLLVPRLFMLYLGSGFHEGRLPPFTFAFQSPPSIHAPFWLSTFMQISKPRYLELFHSHSIKNSSSAKSACIFHVQ